MRQLLIILILTTLISCEKERLIATEGVIQDYTGLDACSWIIEVEENNETISYEPVNLDEFKIEPEEGLEVKFRYKEANEAGSSCMAGPLIELTSIRKR